MEAKGWLLLGCAIGVVVMGIATILDKEWEHRAEIRAVRRWYSRGREKRIAEIRAVRRWYSRVKEKRIVEA